MSEENKGSVNSERGGKERTWWEKNGGTIFGVGVFVSLALLTLLYGIASG